MVDIYACQHVTNIFYKVTSYTDSQIGGARLFSGSPAFRAGFQGFMQKVCVGGERGNARTFYAARRN